MERGNKGGGRREGVREEEIYLTFAEEKMEWRAVLRNQARVGRGVMGEEQRGRLAGRTKRAL